jgi:hypothetical protein
MPTMRGDIMVLFVVARKHNKMHRNLEIRERRQRERRRHDFRIRRHDAADVLPDDDTLRLQARRNDRRRVVAAAAAERRRQAVGSRADEARDHGDAVLWQRRDAFQQQFARLGQIRRRITESIVGSNQLKTTETIVITHERAENA